MSSRSQKDRGPKKSAFSCEGCRRRKVKCGAEQPTCLRCMNRKEACEYKLNPTLSYTQRLQMRIEELEACVASYSDSNRPTVIEEIIEIDACLPAVFGGLSVNKSGRTSFHGPTSFMSPPVPPTGDASSDLPSCGSMQDIASGQRLVMNAWEQRVLETFSSTPEAFQYLLQFHWTWIQPVFNFVYRPAFTRDMDLQGPYFSYTLLSTLLAHSARWRHDVNMQTYLEPYENGAVFSRHAYKLLHEDLRNGRCDIPTIQTCLLLSASECSKGNWTQAWMYSGIAFRLMEDQGINIDEQYSQSKSVALSEEDIEIRKRLFWSCYLWDKVISLYLGRCPAIQRSDISPPLNMLDDSSEDELWTPYGMRQEYTPCQAHSVSSFKWICKLAEILNQLLLTVYNPLSQVKQARLVEVLGQQKHALQQWWKTLPPFLRIIPTDRTQCPPSHIVTLNSLYHTVNILVHRPLLSNRNLPQPDRTAVLECLSSASTITSIFELFSTTFGHGYSIMTLSYSLYIAASIFLLQLQATKQPDPRILDRLQFCIDSLESISSVNVVLQQVLQVIRAEKDKLNAASPNIGTKYTNAPGSFIVPPQEPVEGAAFDLQNASSSMTGLETFDFDTMELPQDMLEAIASIEPIRAYVGNESNAFYQ